MTRTVAIQIDLPASEADALAQFLQRVITARWVCLDPSQSWATGIAPQLRELERQEALQAVIALRLALALRGFVGVRD